MKTLFYKSKFWNDKHVQFKPDHEYGTILNDDNLYKKIIDVTTNAVQNRLIMFYDCFALYLHCMKTFKTFVTFLLMIISIMYISRVDEQQNSSKFAFRKLTSFTFNSSYFNIHELSHFRQENPSFHCQILKNFLKFSQY